MKTKVILRCVHGSWLYGLATPQSDRDYYEIYDFLNKNWRPKKQANQTIDGEEDLVRISLDRFEHLCYMGVPQAVEVLFSPPESWVEVDDSWEDISSVIRDNLPGHMEKILDTYKRTAMNFYKGDIKRKRHAFRLLINALELKMHGEMHSRLTTIQRDFVCEVVTNAFFMDDHFHNMLFETFGDL